MDDPRLTQSLRELADHAGDDDVLPAGLMGRARRRLARNGLVALAGVVVFAVMTTTAIGALTSDKESDPTPQVVASAPDATNGEQPPDSMKGELVASGTGDGYKWWLTAYKDERGALCTELSVEEPGGGGSGGGCGELDQEKHPIGLSEQHGGPFASAYGDVPLDVDRVELRLKGGDTRSIPLYDAPPGFDLPVRFFVDLPFPRTEAEEFIAYDSAGKVVGRQEVFGDDSHPVVKEGPRILIDEAEIKGIPYTFKGNIAAQELPDGGFWEYPCTQFMLGEDQRYGGGGSCEIPLARGHDVNFSESTFEEQPDIVPVFGATTEKVDRVTIELGSGEVFEAKMYEFPEDPRFRFFLVFLDHVPKGDPAGHVVAYRGSEEIERVKLCDSVPSGGTCGP
ncbi:MAG: hypothetical protein QOH90_563 [Actinomycetota bacterium]|nr:hypothetical protein [Actinomycetota bacterium]